MSSRLTDSELKKASSAALETLSLNSDLKQQAVDVKLKAFILEVKRLLLKHSSLQVIVLPDSRSKT
jgi:hypothetical protein